MAVWFGLVIALITLLCTAAYYTLIGSLPQIPRADPGDLRGLVHTLYAMCAYAPLTEEVVFRSLLTVAVLPTLGQWGTIAASGVVFALAHIVGGNPGPDNQIAGFMLEWALLRSQTILVPLSMHAAGNLVAVGFRYAAWYWL